MATGGFSFGFTASGSSGATSACSISGAFGSATPSGSGSGSIGGPSSAGSIFGGFGFAAASGSSSGSAFGGFGSVASSGSFGRDGSSGPGSMFAGFGSAASSGGSGGSSGTGSMFAGFGSAISSSGGGGSSGPGSMFAGFGSAASSSSGSGSSGSGSMFAGFGSAASSSNGGGSRGFSSTAFAGFGSAASSSSGGGSSGFGTMFAGFDTTAVRSSGSHGGSSGLGSILGGSSLAGGSVGGSIFGSANSAGPTGCGGGSSGFGMAIGGSASAASAGTSGLTFGAAPSSGGGFAFAAPAAAAAQEKRLDKLPDFTRADEFATADVFVHGSGECDQLGLGDAQRERQKPTLIKALANKHVLDLAVGALHVVCVAADGRLYSWGCNDDGALGRPTDGCTDCEPHCVRLPPGVAARKISCGDNHSCMLDSRGRAWLWGTYKDSNGHIGIASKRKLGGGGSGGGDEASAGSILEKSHEPELVLEGCTQIASGANHTLALVPGASAGKVFSWGSNATGQLGIQGGKGCGLAEEVIAAAADVEVAAREGGGTEVQGKRIVRLREASGEERGAMGMKLDQVKQALAKVAASCTSLIVEVPEREVSKPEKRSLLNPQELFLGDVGAGVSGVFAGSDWTFITADDGGVHGCGLNGDGQLGLGFASMAVIVLRRLKGLRGASWLGGGLHMSAALKDGQVLTWGRAEECGQGQGPSAPPILEPRSIAGLPRMRRLRCGAHHTLACSEAGDVFAWGCGLTHQLANRPRDVSDPRDADEDPEDELRPYRVTSKQLEKRFVLLADGGAQHSVELAWSSAYSKLTEAPPEEATCPDPVATRQDSSAAPAKRRRGNTDGVEPQDPPHDALSTALPEASTAAAALPAAAAGPKPDDDVPMEPVSSLWGMLAVDDGKWKCDGCSLRWEANLIKCKACEAYKPGMSEADIAAAKRAEEKQTEDSIALFRKPSSGGTTGVSQPFSGFSVGSSDKPAGPLTFGFGIGASTSPATFGFGSPTATFGVASTSGGSSSGGSGASGFSVGFSASTSGGSPFGSSPVIFGATASSTGSPSPAGASSSGVTSFGGASAPPGGFGAGFGIFGSQGAGTSGATGSAAAGVAAFGGFAASPAAPAYKEKELQEAPDWGRKGQVPLGDVFVHGSGECDQLGLGDAQRERQKPTLVKNLVGKHVCNLAVGALHVICLASDGRLYSWGCNDDGALGRPEDAEATPDCEPHPVSMPGGVTVRTVSCGDNHSCALDTLGRVWLWGTYKDSNGHIGIARKRKQGGAAIADKSAEPAVVLEGCTEIASGANHTLALVGSGQVYCWGSNGTGQLGLKSGEGCGLAEQVLAANPGLKIAAREGGGTEVDGKRIVRLKEASGGERGAMSMTVEQVQQALSAGTTSTIVELPEREVPKPEKQALLHPQDLFLGDLGDDVSGVFAGSDWTFITTADGGVYGCGLNGDGQLGLGFASMAVPVLRPLKGLRGASWLGGGLHASAAMKDGQVFTWGRAEECGQGLGATAPPILEPRVIAGLPKIRSLRCGAHHSLACSAAGDVFAWGCGLTHQLGNRPRDVNDPRDADEDPEDELKPYRLSSKQLEKRFVLLADGGAQHSVELAWSSTYGELTQAPLGEAAAQDPVAAPEASGDVPAKRRRGSKDAAGRPEVVGVSDSAFTSGAGSPTTFFGATGAAGKTDAAAAASASPGVAAPQSSSDNGATSFAGTSQPFSGFGAGAFDQPAVPIKFGFGASDSASTSGAGSLTTMFGAAGSAGGKEEAAAASASPGAAAEQQAPAKPAQGSLWGALVVDDGKWKCDVCSLRWEAKVIKCKACEAFKPGMSEADIAAAKQAEEKQLEASIALFRKPSTSDKGATSLAGTSQPCSDFGVGAGDKPAVPIKFGFGASDSASTSGAGSLTAMFGAAGSAGVFSTGGSSGSGFSSGVSASTAGGIFLGSGPAMFGAASSSASSGAGSSPFGSFGGFGGTTSHSGQPPVFGVGAAASSSGSSGAGFSMFGSQAASAPAGTGGTAPGMPGGFQFRPSAPAYKEKSLLEKLRPCKQGEVYLGDVFVHGSGECDQLGLGDIQRERQKPTLLKSLVGKQVCDLAVGSLHVICLTSDGRLFSWGCNDDGALGRPEGSEATPDFEPHPVSMPGGVTVRTVSCGDNHSCALDTLDRAWLWGTYKDSNGHIGIARKRKQGAAAVADKSAEPAVVLEGCKQIASGANHTLALVGSGQVYCWGSNGTGQLGLKSGEGCGLAEQVLLAGSGPKVVAREGGGAEVDGKRVVRLREASGAERGAMSMTVEEVQKALSVGTTSAIVELPEREVPKPEKQALLHPQELALDGISAAVEGVFAGSDWTFITATDGGVYGCGLNGDGQLGLGFASMAVTALRPLKCLRSVAWMGGGLHASAALNRDGKVFTWGRAEECGQGLGASAPPILEPREVPDLPKILHLRCGAHHSLACSLAGDVFAWGCGLTHQLGNRPRDVSDPRDVDEDPEDELRPYRLSSKQLESRFVLLADGGAQHSVELAFTGYSMLTETPASERAATEPCPDAEETGQLPPKRRRGQAEAPGALSDPAATPPAATAETADPPAMLAAASGSGSGPLAAMFGISNSSAPGFSFSISASTAGGSIFGPGATGFGAVPVSTGSSAAPSSVSGFAAFGGGFGGSNASTPLLFGSGPSSGSLPFGTPASSSGGFSILGNQMATSSGASSGTAGVFAFAGGFAPTLAGPAYKEKKLAQLPEFSRSAEVPLGDVFVHGSGECDQLGLGDAQRERQKPTLIKSLAGRLVCDLAVGALHVMCLASDGRLYSWGCNDDGALGRPEGSEAAPDCEAHPVSMPGGVTVRSISCGDNHSCALDSLGRVWLWGTYKDSNGHIGIARKRKQGAAAIADKSAEPAVVLEGCSGVVSGANHTVALANSGQIFCWGSNGTGQLGVKSGAGCGLSEELLADCSDVAVVARAGGGTEVDGKRVIRLRDASGAERSAASMSVEQLRGALSKAGTGVIVEPPERDVPKPEKQCLLHPQEMFLGELGADASGIFAGSDWTFITAADGSVFACGLNGDGQLGVGFQSMAVKTLRIVKVLQGANWLGGGLHSSAALQGGQVFTWGRAEECGQGLGAGAADILEPRVVSGLPQIRTLRCGAHHTLACSAAGDVFTWGCGLTHQLGNRPRDVGDPKDAQEDPEDELKPYRVSSRQLESRFVLLADGGAQHSVELAWGGSYAALTEAPQQPISTAVAPAAAGDEEEPALPAAKRLRGEESASVEAAPGGASFSADVEMLDAEPVEEVPAAPTVVETVEAAERRRQQQAQAAAAREELIERLLAEEAASFALVESEVLRLFTGRLLSEPCVERAKTALPPQTGEAKELSAVLWTPDQPLHEEVLERRVDREARAPSRASALPTIMEAEDVRLCAQLACLRRDELESLLFAVASRDAATCDAVRRSAWGTEAGAAADAKAG